MVDLRFIGMACSISLQCFVDDKEWAAKRGPRGLEDSNMRISHRLRAGLIALIAIVAASVPSATFADFGMIRITIFKAGWFIGGSAGSGVLTYRGRNYPLSIGGISAGLVFGASETHFVGRVSNIFSPGDVAGVYGAGGAGAALVVGAGAIVLTNEKGAVLQLSGRQIGLIANLDLSGMAISLH